MAVLEHEQAEHRTPRHRPVMVSEVLDVLVPAPGQTAFDLTVGTGGHAIALARAVGADGKLVGIDADGTALSIAGERLSAGAPCAFELVQARFSQAPRIAAELGIAGFDLVMADLGIGTHQLMQPQRGFAFDSRGRLDMRFDTTRGPSAWEVVNRMDQQDLADIFYTLGEERYSRQIAARICAARQERPIDTPAELSQLIKGVVARRTRRGRTWRIHPATRVMMALRIYVNHELEELELVLDAVPGLLNEGGRVCVLTYHSLEARLVKRTWREQACRGVLELITARAVKPGEQEILDNPRARSAQLRAARKPEGIRG